MADQEVEEVNTEEFEVKDKGDDVVEVTPEGKRKKSAVKTENPLATRTGRTILITVSSSSITKTHFHFFPGVAMNIDLIFSTIPMP